MKKAWRDGTQALLFEPEGLLSRLCAEHEPGAEHSAGPRRRPVPRAPPKGQLVLRLGP